jgi:hypothetical protein
VVEGAHLRTGRDDVTKQGVHVPEHVTTRDADDAKACTSEHRVTGGIALRLISVAVALAVNFDNQTSLEAGEIDGHFAERELLPELVTVRAFAKLLPEQDFRKAHLLPQQSCALDLLDGGSKNRRIDPAWAPSTTRLRRAVPLPVPGRI